ncbi:retrovirus-related pol polyprotein from transposon TNT 1-94 [Tanacetum coccineum]
MSTSKTYQQSLADASSETRPPMLKKGSYIPWASRFRRYLNRKRDNRKWLLKALDEGPYVFKIFTPEGSTIPRLQTVEDLKGDDLLLYDAEMEVMNLILLFIPNEIYNSVDACTSAKVMWKRVEREALISFLNSLQLEWLKYVTQVYLAKQLIMDSFNDLFDYLQQFEKLVNASRAKKLKKSHGPLALVAHTGLSSRQTSSYYVTHPTSVVDYDDEYQQDNVHNNYEDPLVSAMSLLAKAITQKFSNPTNNRLRASSNTRNQAIVQGDKVNIQSRNSGNTGRNSRRAYGQEEVVEGMNAPKDTGNVQRTLRTPSSGNTSTVQCYNCSGKGHYARNCPKPRNDFLFPDTSRMEEIEELSANICLMVRIQPADHTSDDGPSYESAFINLEAKLKKNVDLILKLGNSLQGMFMLGPKPLSVYDQQLKHGLGYPNPYTLKQAISKCPKLYIASSLGNLEILLNVRDSEDTLEDAFKSQQKIKEKINDPIAVANKQNCWTINYKQLNALYEDFVPQKELSVEQKYFLSSSIPSVKIPVSKNMPTESPLIKELDKIKCCFEKLSVLIQQNCKRASIFYTSPTQIQINDFCQDQVKPILNVLKVYLDFFRNLFQRDIKEMKDVFESTERLNATSRVRRPMSRDSHDAHSVLDTSKKAAKNVAVYVRKNKQTDNTSANVILNKENVINVDVANDSKAKTLLCVSCMQNVLIPYHDKCLAKLKLNVRLNVRRTFFTNSRTSKSSETNFVAPKTRFSKKETQSKTLDTTFVVSKSKIDVESASKAKDKVSSASRIKKRNLRDKPSSSDRSVGLGHKPFSVGTILVGRESNLYTISISDMAASSPVCLMSKATSTKSWLWHRRLSHLNFGTINDLTRLDLVDGLLKFKYGKDQLCSACEMGKSKKASHPPKLVSSDHSKLELLHMDLCSPMRVASINGKKYILVIVDDFSRYTWVYFLYSKDEIPEIIKKFIAQAQLNYKAKVCKIRTDNDDLGKMKPKADIGVFIGYSETSTGFQIYNRRTKMIMETIHVKFHELIAMASEHDCLEPELQRFHNHNSSVEPMHTPSKEDLDNLFSLMFEEYYEQKSSYTPIYSAAHLTQVHKDSSSTSAIIIDTHEAPLVVTTSNEQTSPISLTEADEFNQEDTAEFDVPSNVQNFPQVQPSTHIWTKDHPLDQVIGDPSKPVMTRQRLHTDSEVCMYALTVSTIEPKNIKEAMADHSWIESMQDGLNQFERLQVWELVPRPEGKNIIALK